MAPVHMIWTSFAYSIVYSTCNTSLSYTRYLAGVFLLEVGNRRYEVGEKETKEWELGCKLYLSLLIKMW
jgi:hypothetical protein